MTKPCHYTIIITHHLSTFTWLAEWKNSWRRRGFIWVKCSFRAVVVVMVGGGLVWWGVVMRFIPKIDIMSLLRWCHNKIILVATTTSLSKSDTLLWKMIMIMMISTHSACTAVSKKAAKFIASIIYFISLSVLCQF